jgi:hypothetical protein
MNGQPLTNLPTANASGQALAFGQNGAQLQDLTAASGGSGNINQFNVNGIQNPAAPVYGAVASSTTITCTANGTANLVGCSSAGDFANGQLVAVMGAGPANALGAPTGVAAYPTSSHGQNTFGGHNLANTVIQYCVTAVDANMGESACSAPFSFDNSDAGDPYA